MSLRVLSLGAGVQSTTLLLMVLEGTLHADVAVFSDTGWEPQSVYRHLEQLDELADAQGFQIKRVSHSQSIRQVNGESTAGRPPFYLLGPNGPGMLRRQCTKVYKVQPIRRELRRMMKQHNADHVQMLLGISTDEIQRMRKSDVRYIENVYPLIDRQMRRVDCLAYLSERGISAPRSACIGCPYHSDDEWRKLRDQHPDEWQDAIAYEREVQQDGLGLIATPYLHRQRVPLDEVDLTTLEDHGQMTLDDECEGMCGV